MTDHSAKPSEEAGPSCRPQPVTRPPRSDRVERAYAILEGVRAEVVGRDREVREILAAMLAHRHVLLEGPPGTSKSTIVRAVARSMEMPFHFVEGSIELSPAKLLGHFNPAKVLQDNYRQDYFEMGPLTLAMQEGGVLYLEEFNRMSSEAANLLITPMEEGLINIPRYGLVTAAADFTIICSQNPYDDVGTLQVSRAFLDRVVRIRMNYQSEDEEAEIVRLRTCSEDESLIRTAVRITRLTREAEEIKIGASVRAAIDIVTVLENLMLLSDGNVGEEDLADACKMALTSKIWPAETLNATPEEIVERMIDRARSQLAGDFYLGAESKKKVTS